jgi:mycothiol synthase
LQLYRRTDHVETWSPPYVEPYCSPVLEIRPCATEDEQERALALYNTVWPWEAITMDEVRFFRSSSRAYTSFLARRDGVDAGSVAAGVLPAHPHRAWTRLTVLPEHRRTGVGTALYRTLSDWLRERGIRQIRAPVGEDDPESLAFAERRGFRESERNGRMILDLTGVEAPAAALPQGVAITTFAERPELAQAIYEVACEALPDVPGEEDWEELAFEDWLPQIEGPNKRRETTFVAVAGDEVVGYARLSLTAAQPKVAFHDMTGVKRAWRRRGIAGALKRAQIAWAKEHGYERLETENEVRNEPIRRLNRALGYRPAPGHVVVNGPLAP